MDTHLATQSKPSAADIAGDAQDLAALLQRLMATTPPQAEGARHSARTVVLWVYRDYEGRWWVRQEGGGFERFFPGRERAAACARAAGRAAGSYRLYLQLKDGRVIEENFNLGGAASNARDDVSPLLLPAASAPA